MKDIKEISTAELEAELLERHKRGEPGQINDYRNVVALRNKSYQRFVENSFDKLFSNQLLDVVKKSVEYNEKTDMIMMKKEDYDILIKDWEDATANWKSDWKMEIDRIKNHGEK